MPKAGDIVFVKFPFAEKASNALHPALVLEDLGGRRFVLAYGSSKQVDASAPPRNEVVATGAETLAACGLNRPTRFDLNIRAQMFVGHRPCGRLPASLIPQLYRAAVHCKLVGA